MAPAAANACGSTRTSGMASKTFRRYRAISSGPWHTAPLGYGSGKAGTPCSR